MAVPCPWRWRGKLLDIPTMSGSTLKRCLIRYVRLGLVRLRRHQTANAAMLLVPLNYAPWLWGWPTRFLNRMSDRRSTAFVVGRNDGNDFSRRHPPT